MAFQSWLILFARDVRFQKHRVDLLANRERVALIVHERLRRP
jgi:hypothetical protein